MLHFGWLLVGLTLAPVQFELNITSPAAGLPVRIPLGRLALARDFGLAGDALQPVRATCDGVELPAVIDDDGTWDTVPDKLIFPAPRAGTSAVQVTLDLAPPLPSRVIGGGERLRALQGPVGVEMASQPIPIDWDADGDLDLLVGSYSRRGYLWYFERDGELKPGVRMLAQAAPSGIVTSNGSVYGRGGVADLDQDGDLDLVVTGGKTTPLLFETRPTRAGLRRLVYRGPYEGRVPTGPPTDVDGTPLRMKLRDVLTADGTPVLDPAGRPLSLPELNSGLTVADWNGDGRQDLVLGSHSGFVYVATHASGDRPVFDQPRRLSAREAPVKGGSICVPTLGDWDGDGDRDLLLGTEYGTIEVWENNGHDWFVSRGLLAAGGETIEYPGAGCQDNDDWWGYAIPQLVDWDRDGDLDLLGSSSRGYHTLYRNDSDGHGPLKLAAGVRLQLQGRDWRTSWRVRPALWDLDGDGDLDLIAVDDDGDDDRTKEDNDGWVRRFENVSRQPWSPELQAGEVLQDTAGNPLRGGLAQPYAYGRDKLVAADWDGDGVWDLLQGRHGRIDWWHNVGTASAPVFEPSQRLQLEGQPFHLGGHSLGFELHEWTGDDRPDLVVTEQSGWVRVFDRRLFEAQTATATIARVTCGEQTKSGFEADLYRGDGDSRWLSDFTQCRPEDALAEWNYRTNVNWAGHGNNWVCASATDTPPELTYPLDATGRYDVYVGTRSVDWPVRFQVRLLPDGEWFTIEPPVAEGKQHHNVELPWLKGTDLTGHSVEIRHVGAGIYLDYFRLCRAIEE